MWAGGDHGLDHFDQQGRVIGNAEHIGIGSGRPFGDGVRALLRDHAGGLWVGTNEGLAHQEKGASEFSLVPVGGAKVAGGQVRSLLETGDGRIWVGMTDGDLHILLPSGGADKTLEEAIRPDLGRLAIRTLAEAAPGIVWVGTEGDGIVAVNSVTGRTRRIRHDGTRATSLPHDLVFSLYRDHSGLLWAGTYSGLGIHDPTQDAVLTVFGGSNAAEGLRGADITSTLAGRDGTVWVTYIEGGADILDPSGHRLTALSSGSSHLKNSLPPGLTIGLAQTEGGDVYLGTFHGLYRASHSEGLAHVQLVHDRPDPSILSLLSDSSGLWIGTRGDGLWRLGYGVDQSRRRIDKVLSGYVVSAMAPAGSGRLWMGTFQGLYLFDPRTAQAQLISPDPRNAGTVPGGLISSLLTDKRGRLWVATFGGGVAVSEGALDDGPLRFRRIGISEGLPDLNVCALLEDHVGGIWVSTGTGLVARIDPETLDIRVLRRAEGVGIRSFALNGGTVTPQGEVLFGGDGGVTVIRPDRLAAWKWRPPVVVTDLRIGGRQLPPQAVNGSGDGHSLNISPDANSLSVEFASLDYSAPERNQYAYRLEGYDVEWVPTDSTRRLASYTNLPPGRYTLHLRGSNRDGVWSESTLDVPFLVLPAWYQTVPFRLTAAIFASLAVWLLVRVRTAYLRHRQVALEQQVDQRTSELVLANSQLAARTAELGRTLDVVAESRTKVANLLDTSGQGFLSFGPDLIVEPDYSRACVSILDREPAGIAADKVLFEEDGERAELFRRVLESAFASDDQFKRRLLFSLLPSIVERRGRILKAEYRVLDNGHVMVVLTDATEEHRLSKKVANERLHLAMIVTAVTDSRDFFDAIDSYRSFFRHDLAQILPARATPQSIHQEISRQVHTFKGTFAQLNFDATPKMLHALEERLAEFPRQDPSMSIGKIVELVLSVDYHATLEADLAIVRDALGEDFLSHGKGVFLPMPQARKLRAVAEQLLARGTFDLEEDIRSLFIEFRNLDKVTLPAALMVYRRVVVDVAKRLNKEVAPLSIDGGEDLWLDPEIYGPFLRSLIHVFRNAVVHGIEDAEERLVQGKEPVGRIDCIIRPQGDGFTLTIADDGGGIDLNALRDRAASIGLMSREQAAILEDEEVLSLIFADNVSVREEADELSGRGIGLAAVRAETVALGGNVTVASSPGQGARFVFFFPSPERLAKQGLADAGTA